jgi:hypothetical protein
MRFAIGPTDAIDQDSFVAGRPRVDGGLSSNNARELSFRCQGRQIKTPAKPGWQAAPYGRDALRQLYILLPRGKVEGCSLERFENATGLKLMDANGIKKRGL